jgi:hypothetical protein
MNKFKTMEKTLVKSKIVLEDDGKSLVTYFWKKTFLCFGYWYPFGSSSGVSKISEEKLNRINDNEVSKLFYENFIKGFK